jgi:peptidoglycan/LPS O-acetylase OafA/YrhL
VLVWHYFVCQVIAEPKSLISYCRLSLSLTRSGVDLFFVLSGFLIAGILLEHRNATNFFQIFYLRRIFRIFPLYFVVYALYIFVKHLPIFTQPAFSWLLHDPLPLWSYPTFTQNFFMGARGDFGPHWLGITWSLAVEEQFYLFVPFLIYFLPQRALVCALVAIILSASFLRYISPGFHAYVNTPWRSDALLAGALLAVLVRSHSFASLFRKHSGFVLTFFYILLLGAAVMTIRPQTFGVFNYLWLAGLYSTFILTILIGNAPLLGRVLESAPLVYAGQRSYGIYMFHEAVNGLLHGFIRSSAPVIRTLSDAGVTALALFITLALAMLSYRFLESPILRFGQRFRYKSKRSSGPTQQNRPTEPLLKSRPTNR